MVVRGYTITNVHLEGSGTCGRHCAAIGEERLGLIPRLSIGTKYPR